MSCQTSHGAARGASRRRARALRPVSGGLLAAGVFLLSAAAATPALADSKYSRVLWANSDTIVVESNGHAYTHMLSGGPITGTIEIGIETHFLGRVEFWSAWPALGFLDKDGVDRWANVKSAGEDKTYGSPRPVSVVEHFEFVITPAQYNVTAVVACNSHAEMLKQQGKSTAQVLGEDRQIELAIDARMDSVVTGPGESVNEVQVWESYKKAKVICKASEALEPIAGPIAGADLEIEAGDVVNVGGSCKLRLTGSIVGQQAGMKVKFLYVDETGKQSDLKSVTTGTNGFVKFEHEYPLGEGLQRGKLRMVGQSHAFFSNWASFETECKKAGPQNLTEVPTPRARQLHIVASEETVLFKGKICPASMRVRGIVRGRAPADGHAVLVAGTTPLLMEAFRIADGQQLLFEAEQQLDWEGQEQAHQSINYALYVTDMDGKVVDQKQQPKEIICRDPEVSANLSVASLGKAAQNGYVCPVRGRAMAHIKTGDEGFSGKLVIYALGAAKQQFEFGLPAHYTTFYPYDHDLQWDGTTVPGQSVTFSMKLLDQHDYIVASEEVVQKFDCTEIVTTGAVRPGGGLASQQLDPGTGLPGPAKPPATTHFVPPAPLSITSPKGEVKRFGRIRLAGGFADATYDLTFYRKVSGGYQKVTAAGLPAQMTGKIAAFKLAALTGATEWRLEVCPVAAGPAACRTSDFQVQ